MRPLRPLLVLATSVATAVTLVGCADSGADTAVTSYVTQTITRGSAEDPEQQEGNDDASEPATDTGLSHTDAAKEAYAGILNDPGQYSFSAPGERDFTGEYLYALADITGDGVPELLLEAITQHNLNPVRVFSADADGELTSPDDVLIDGAASAGGSRTALSTSPAGDRIYQEQWRSIAPDVDVEAFELRGDNLVSTGETWTYDMQSPSADLVRIEFQPSDDRGPLEAMVPTTGGAAAGGNAPVEEAPAPTGGNTVSGTVRVLTAPELAELQGRGRTPNGEDSSYRYAIFVFDAPTTFSAQSSGNAGAPEERQASMVRLGQQTPYSSDGSGFELDGQSLTLSFDPSSCWFPSDTSLPTGEPNCSAFSQ